VNRSINFDGPDGPLGAPSDGGPPWSLVSGTWAQESGRLRLTTAGTHYALTETGAADVEVSVTIPTRGASGVEVGVVVRASDADNFLVLTATWDGSSGTFKLYRRESGSYTLLDTTAVAWAAGDAIALRASGSTLTAKRNGAAIWTATNTFNTTATKHGLLSNFDTTSTLDGFAVADLAALTKPTTPVWNGSHPLATGCLLYLPLTEGAGTPVDLAGGATVSLGGAAWATGDFGPALAFPAGPTATVSYAPPFVDDGTYMTAFRWDVVADAVLAWTGPYGGAGWYVHNLAGARRMSWVTGTNEVDLPSGTYPPPPGRNFVVALVKRGSTREVWLDGVQVWTAGTATPATATGPLYLGAYGPGGEYRLTGLLDLAAYWTRALSATELATLAADPWAQVRGGSPAYRPRPRTLTYLLPGVGL
jgi:hypothetical protein